MFRLIGLLVCLTLSGSAAAQRILVLPVSSDGLDEGTSKTLGRAIETSVRNVVVDGEVITADALQTSIQLSQLQDCLGDEAVGACTTEIADAANADAVIRPHVGKLGDELLLTLTVTEGSSARLMAQGQRRGPVDAPGQLLDVIPGLSRQVLETAGLARLKPKAVPVVPIAVGVGGVLGAGVGVGILLIRNSTAEKYGAGELDRGSASAFEAVGDAALIGGAVLVVGGALAAIGGAGVAAWTIVGDE